MEDALGAAGDRRGGGRDRAHRPDRRAAAAARLRAARGDRPGAAPAAVRRGAPDARQGRARGGGQPLAHRPALSETASGEPGLGPPRWAVALERARGGAPGDGSWRLEMARFLCVWSPNWAITAFRGRTGRRPRRRAPRRLNLLLWSRRSRTPADWRLCRGGAGCGPGGARTLADALAFVPDCAPKTPIPRRT